MKKIVFVSLIILLFAAHGLADVGRHFDIVLKYLTQGDLEKAEIAYKYIYDLHPNNYLVVNRMASIYFNRGKFKEALPLFEFVTTTHRDLLARYRQTSIKNPYYCQIHYKYGYCLLMDRQYKKAARAFKKVLKSRNYKLPGTNLTRFYGPNQLSPKKFYKATRYHLGIAAFRSGDEKTAMKQYEILMNSAPEKAEDLLKLIKKK